ncbi:hypothetical protein [Winogradskyella alexanderae]|uniref:Uncharacterized protein n=1 Tax=Winogradskyella alexanderae TaxID=2877123 RepID=A0ABS7XS72_9FLAO|nr:hypothetical protein [Winogradskyella alexanderae]MCA0132615.1 hypothetical protein [Winogradskyella alexanderae]
MIEEKYINRGIQHINYMTGLSGFNIAYLNFKRSELLLHWKGFAEDYLKLQPGEKLMNLNADIIIFSVFNDNEVLDLMTNLKVSSSVTNYFIDGEQTSKMVKQFIDSSKFEWDFHNIMSIFNIYSYAFFSNKLREDSEISDTDLNNHLLGIHRREIKGKLTREEQVLKNTFNKIESEANAENEDYKLLRAKNGLRSIVKKAYNFPHKLQFHLMYIHDLERNKELIGDSFNESDYKCEFFDLVNLLIRDKEILWGKEGDDLELTYGPPGNRRFKIKRVEQLFLNLSDFYSI